MCRPPGFFPMMVRGPAAYAAGRDVSPSGLFAAARRRTVWTEDGGRRTGGRLRRRWSISLHSYSVKRYSYAKSVGSNTLFAAQRFEAAINRPASSVLPGKSCRFEYEYEYRLRLSTSTNLLTNRSYFK